MTEFIRDNLIELNFYDIYNNLTNEGKCENKLYKLPFRQIMNEIFDNSKIHEVLHKLTGGFRSVVQIKSYLTDISFLKKFLFDILQNVGTPNISHSFQDS